MEELVFRSCFSPLLAMPPCHSLEHAAPGECVDSHVSFRPGFVLRVIGCIEHS